MACDTIDLVWLRICDWLYSVNVPALFTNRGAYSESETLVSSAVAVGASVVRSSTSAAGAAGVLTRLLENGVLPMIRDTRADDVSRYCPLENWKIVRIWVTVSNDGNNATCWNAPGPNWNSS